VRFRQCPQTGPPGIPLPIPIDGDEDNGSVWKFIHNKANRNEFKLKSEEVGLCLGEEVVTINAGHPGKPGPARVRYTWQMIECVSAPWWNFLYLFENIELDERICKVAGDPDHCWRFKNGVSKDEFELYNLSADDPSSIYVAQKPGETGPLSEYDQALYDKYKQIYEYYDNYAFDPYDNTDYKYLS
jgi:hypothetical protein